VGIPAAVCFACCFVSHDNETRYAESTEHTGDDRVMESVQSILVIRLFCLLPSSTRLPTDVALLSRTRSSAVKSNCFD
jgi:hypothetical protein